MKYTPTDQKIIDTYNSIGSMDYYKKCAAVGRACNCNPTKVYKVMQRQARVETVREHYGKYSIAELNIPYQIFEVLDRIGIYRIYECTMISGEYWKQYVRLGDRWWDTFQNAVSEYFGVNPRLPFDSKSDGDKVNAANALIEEMKSEYEEYKRKQSHTPKTSLADTLSLLSITKLMSDYPYT